MNIGVLSISLLSGGLLLLIIGIVLLAIYGKQYSGDNTDTTALGAMVGGIFMLLIGLGLLIWGAIKLFGKPKASKVPWQHQAAMSAAGISPGTISSTQPMYQGSPLLPGGYQMSSPMPQQQMSSPMPQQQMSSSMPQQMSSPMSQQMPASMYQQQISGAANQQFAVPMYQPQQAY